tara:strand:+ start:1813 stop:1929 length:117 start_codon:yes stop_codon:yes gene_type:complete
MGMNFCAGTTWHNNRLLCAQDTGGEIGLNQAEKAVGDV